MELVEEKTELLRRLSVYALSKVHLDRYGSFCKILLIVSWDINLHPGTVHGTQNENLLHVLPFHNCIFLETAFNIIQIVLAKTRAGINGMSLKKEECTLFT